MEWKLFKEKEPEEGRWIVYGNHRGLDVMIYRKDNMIPKETKKIQWKDITHWDYCNLPPRISEEMIWK